MAVKLIVGENDLATTYPVLARQWHPTKNTLTPQQVTAGSTKKVWWLCEKEHEWEAACYSRVAGNGCPVCSGRKVLVGYNDLVTTHPEIASEWHPTKNGTLSATDVTANSHKNVWWLGACGHEWETRVSERTRGRGCPVCKSKKVVPGINDLATKYPEIAAQWHPTLNKRPASSVLPQSNKSAWWLCEQGHEYEASPSHRVTRDSACPICSNKKVLVGYNDLATTYPEIAAQWHPTKNTLSPKEVTIGADKMAWWLCDKGHEWEALVYSRRHNGCPYCSGNKVWVGFNDLTSVNPALAAEWHPTKNEDLTSCDVTAGSNLKVWWLGACGHDWPATISSRNSGCGCPVCAEARKRSFPEAAVFLYVSRIFPDAVSPALFPWLGRRSLDVYIPTLQTAIEYDGQAWHQNVERDYTKNRLCEENGVRLIRIREPECPRIEAEHITLRSFEPKALDDGIRTVLHDFLHQDCGDIDTCRDEDVIRSLVKGSDA